MKYDEEVFYTSMKAKDKAISSKNKPSEDVKKKQKELLKILLAKFQEQLKEKGKIEGELLRVQFKSAVYVFNQGKTETGYREIEELVKSGDFDSFASQYCFYLGDKNFNVPGVSYYEVIWDYKTYFEQLKKSDEGIYAIKNAKKKVKEEKRQVRALERQAYTKSEKN